MERVTVNMEAADLDLVRRQADEAGVSLSAYVARAARERALADVYAAAAEVEREHPPTAEEIKADASFYGAVDEWAPQAVPGAA